jgi:hypothetical protein
LPTKWLNGFRREAVDAAVPVLGTGVEYIDVEGELILVGMSTMVNS